MHFLATFINMPPPQSLKVPYRGCGCRWVIFQHSAFTGFPEMCFSFNDVF